MNIKKYMAKILMLSMTFAFFSVAVAQDEPETITPKRFLADEAKSTEQTDKFMKDVGSRCFPWTTCCGKKIDNGVEFINMKTTIIYDRGKASDPEVRTFGYAEKSQGFLDPFPRNKNIHVIVQFNPEMRSKGMYSCEFGGVSVKNLLIPVEIRMEKPRNVIVNYEGGIVKDRVKTERDAKGWMIYNLYIKNDPDHHPQAEFTIKPAFENASMEMKIIYGAENNKFVNSDCDITETIKFKKMVN